MVREGIKFISHWPTPPRLRDVFQFPILGHPSLFSLTCNTCNTWSSKNLTWSSKPQLCQSLPCFRSSSSCRQQRTSSADNKNLRPHFIFHFMLDHISSSSCPQQRTFSAGNGNTFQATLPSIVYFNI